MRNHEIELMVLADPSRMRENHSSPSIPGGLFSKDPKAAAVAAMSLE